MPSTSLVKTSILTRGGVQDRRFRTSQIRGVRKRTVIDGVTEALMAAPSVVMVGVFVLLPIAIAFYLSLTDWNGFSENPNWVGWGNYRAMAEDPYVIRSAQFTAIVAIVGTIACNVAGLGLALLLARPTRTNSFLRALFFYPNIIGAVILGFLWSAILGSNGALNAVISGITGSGIPFLADPALAGASVIFVIVWSSFGVNLVLYLAGLQTIPDSLLESARIDGATKWQVLRLIKIPLLAPVITINLVLVLVSLLRTYDVVLALTAGGPAGRTETVAYQILNTSFSSAKLGYGSAQAIVLMIVTVAIAVSITSYRRRAEKDVAA